MNAFMTYKNLTVVDFENMQDHGLYLISGPTGSGKTTLFDAMTFALYGEAIDKLPIFVVILLMQKKKHMWN